MNDYIFGGAVAGLLLILGVGVFLVGRQARVVAALTPYIGDQPAAWMMYVAWAAYVYGALNAVGQVFTLLDLESGRLPSGVAFAYGGIWNALLTFLGSLVSFGHLAALIAVAVMLYRHLKTTEPA